MWHALHLIARPIEVLLRVFCVLTAIVLYPDEEGKIQSKLEDFWIRVDDFQNQSLTRHAAFVTQVAQLESKLLDRVFGNRLFSVQAVGISFCCSVGMMSLGFVLPQYREYRTPSGIVDVGVTSLFSALLLCSLIIGATGVFIATRPVAPPKALRLITCMLFLSGFVTFYFSFSQGLVALQNVGTVILSVVVGGFACDVIFIVLTRRLLRWAGCMTSYLKVLATILLNLLSAIALALVFPFAAYVLTLVVTAARPGDTERISEAILVGLWMAFSNIFDVVLALFFVILASLLLVHRALWPLLTRTLFRMADIGTKGRRAILTTVGFALLAAGISGKVPELVQKVIEKFGG
jgi:hypothetical protein